MLFKTSESALCSTLVEHDTFEIRTPLGKRDVKITCSVSNFKQGSNSGQARLFFPFPFAGKRSGGKRKHPVVLIGLKTSRRSRVDASARHFDAPYTTYCTPDGRHLCTS